GLTDIFIGGANGQQRQLYLQTSKGFVRKDVPDLNTYVFNDVTSAFFFDADGDGDMDLFAGGGGNMKKAGGEEYQNLLYINDGKGNFVLKAGAFPPNLTNCGVGLPLDFNGDGLTDIFIGNRSVAQEYGLSPASYLLINKGNADFEDVTASAAPFLKDLGMLTDAGWADLTGDGKPELIVVGEWMHPHVYTWVGNKFEPIATGLENHYGWWQTIEVADIDKDGDLDLVLGNLGENFYLRPTLNEPVKLWVNDFDNNGIRDKVISYTLQGKDYPVGMKRDITDQMPSLKTANLKHRDFAGKTVQEILGERMASTEPVMVNYASSCIARNDGTGKFSIERLPYDVQLSSIHALHVADINEDGLPDIVAGGNFFDLLPQFCRLDASFGKVLINTGNGNFQTVDAFRSGLYLQGAIRKILPVDLGSGRCLLFIQNNDRPVLMKWK
ncbi:MAG TPA: VCBS repeat-containing protein, partial [Phnomibacter sp.]|nr:VCBS repeat-containing protein [Phnomibacter sp.]